MLLRDPGIAVKIINRKNAAHDHKKADKQDFPGQKSKPATKQDISVGQDLMDTLKANQESNSQPPSFCKDFVNESFNTNPKI